MFRDKQSSIRKEISRLLEIKGKTIAFVKALVFFITNSVFLSIIRGRGTALHLPARATARAWPLQFEKIPSLMKAWIICSRSEPCCRSQLA